MRRYRIRPHQNDLGKENVSAEEQAFQEAAEAQLAAMMSISGRRN